ncbi:MAG: extracellular solute-binding protein [Deltaproteobacteria bacterium]|nr:extracellular solute-binding protein [Deltaproteobacteria bacterium]
MRCLALVALIACGHSGPAPAPIKFLHTFSPDETELFNAIMVEQGLPVEAKLAPFARGQQVIGEMLRAGKNCPDLIRIDATWLPGLAPQLAPAPAGNEWLPEAAVSDVAMPETIDGLVVVRDAAAPAPASGSVGDLVAAARAAKHAERKFPLGLRVDGYWLVPWLRAHGGELQPAGLGEIGDTRATDALAEFAHLFGDVTAPPPPSGEEAPEELRLWTSHDVAYWVTGPWQIGALKDRERLVVSSLAGAPRGGQLLVVPKCARDPAAGWQLARVLTSVEVSKRFAEAFATVPTRKDALAASPALVQQIYAALQTAKPLPRSPVTPLLFDDLNPALAAVVSGDATADEAIAGVRRGWARLTR